MKGMLMREMHIVLFSCIFLFLLIKEAIISREIEQIKREIAIRKRERVSITMLLEPQVN